VTRKSALIIGGLLAGICFMVGLLISSQLPKLRAWILVKIEQTSREQLPVRILPGAIEVNLFPLGTSLGNVKITPKDELGKMLEPLEIERVRLKISFWQLLQGRLRLADVEVRGAKIGVHVPKTEKKSAERPLDGLFKILQQIPINRLILEDISVRAQIADSNLLISVEDLRLDAEKQDNGDLSLVLDSGSTYVGEPGAGGIGVRGSAEIDGEFTRNSIVLSALKFRRGDSFIVASGKLKGDTEALDFPMINLSARSEWQLESMRNWATKTFKQASHLPPLKGRAFIEGEYTRKDHTHKPDADFKFRTAGFQEEKIFLDKISGEGSYKDGVFQIPEAVIENSAGSARLKNLIVKPGETTSITADVNAGPIQMHDLLANLGVGQIPVFMKFSGDLPCAGEIVPKFLIKCHGQFKGEDLIIKDDMKSKDPLVMIKVFTAKGEATIDADKVDYTAELEMPDSRGRSQGSIGYKTGFEIGYEADRLNFKDFARLVNLKLEGVAKIKGSTHGDSHYGVVALDFDGADVWLEDYWLGNAKGALSYKAGMLGFANLQGYHTVSRYNGDVKLDLHKKEITMTGRVPFFDSRDLMKMFSRRVQLPFAVTGTGQAQIKVSGPLQFNYLSYDLKSTLFKGTVAGESFDQANFDVKSNKGEVRAERVQMIKGPATIQLTGQGHPTGNVETTIRGRGLRIEDTSMVLNSGLALSGQVDFDMDLHGHVLSPDTILRGTLTKTAIGDQGLPDSRYSLKFTKKSIEGSGVLLGDVVKADLVFPLDKDAPFHLKMQTQDWNFAPVFLAIAGPGARKNYEGRLSSTIDLSAPRGGFWNASGAINIDKFSLSRGSLTLKSNEPLAMTMKDGHLRTRKFELTGENIFLRVSDNPKPTSKIDLQVNAKMDLSLLALLTPFFEDLRGLLSFTFNVKADENAAGLLGSAYIEKGFLKLFDFQHPFEDIRADILFNQKKILFNSVRSEFGGGRIQASGGMELKGSKNYPLNISGTFDKVSLNIPDKFRTTGSGDLNISGSWFPFLMKGTYEISDGMVTKDIGADAGPSNGIRRDNYLPEFLLQENFVPLLVDMQINFNRGIAIKNELIEGRTIGQLSVKGKPQKPAILGNITFDKETKLLFRDNIFEVKSSNIQFTDPNEINPKLYISATTRAQDYDVNLVITGVGKEPKFTWTSVPQLPEKEIISMLALGATDTRLDKKITSDNQASNTGLQIGTGMIRNNPVSNLVKEKLGFDVQFSTGYDDSSNTQQKVIVSRQFKNNVDVTGSYSFGKSKETEAKLRYRLNEKVSVIGSWQGRDYTETGDQTLLQRNPNKVGLDLEYKIEFK
jgi:translocation and assembly module TamB